jgi:hypothetical protein
MAAVATAIALLCIALSVTSARAQDNAPWYPSLMASEAYDSGRTRLFDQAQFTGSFDQRNLVDVLTTPPQDVYLTPYNVVYQDADSMYVYGGGFGDAGGMGAFVAKLDSKTLKQIWYKPLIHIDTKNKYSAWDYPGVIGMLDDGMLYVIYGNLLTKLDQDGNQVGDTLTLPTDIKNEWPAGDTAYNGFVALPDGTIIAKTVYRSFGCHEQGFDAFLKCKQALAVPHSVLVAINPSIDDPNKPMRIHELRKEIPAFTVGRVTSTRFEGVDYVYVPGPKCVYRYMWQDGVFKDDSTWGHDDSISGRDVCNGPGVQYNDDLSGQTPASAVVVMNDWIMFTTNGSEIKQPCKKPCDSPWLTVWAINQRDSSIRHRIQPFKNMLAQQKRYPLSFAPSAPTVDISKNRIFVFDAGPGKLAALDLAPDGFLQPPTWMVDQRTTEFTALIGPSGQRVLVTTELPHGEDLGNHRSNYVVWRNAETGLELARTHRMPAVLAGTMIQPGYDGNMYYMGASGEITKLTVSPAQPE